MTDDNYLDLELTLKSKADRICMKRQNSHHRRMRVSKPVVGIGTELSIGTVTAIKGRTVLVVDANGSVNEVSHAEIERIAL